MMLTNIPKQPRSGFNSSHSSITHASNSALKKTGKTPANSPASEIRKNFVSMRAAPPPTTIDIIDLIGALHKAVEPEDHSEKNNDDFHPLQSKPFPINCIWIRCEKPVSKETHTIEPTPMVNDLNELTYSDSEPSLQHYVDTNQAQATSPADWGMIVTVLND